MRPPSSEVVVPYEVSCSCGQLLRGQRQPQRQIIRCPGCGRKRFVLPSSPWFAARPPAWTTSSSIAGPLLKRLLLVLVLGGVAAMGLIFLIARPYLRRPPSSAEAVTPADIRAQLEAGERHLREGNVHLALRELKAASVQRDRHPDALRRDEHHRLEQLRRQSDLLAHLLDRSLEEIVRQAMQHHDDEEWNTKFEDYRGRTVVFEDVLRRDGQGQPVLGSYVVYAGDIEARIALEDLILLRQLPLDPPRRWLFGARLAACRREEGGRWVIRFEPDSAVLLTDESATVCCPGPLDEERRAVLKRQDDWLRR
jgi:hypothetical protein